MFTAAGFRYNRSCKPPIVGPPKVHTGGGKNLQRRRGDIAIDVREPGYQEATMSGHSRARDDRRRKRRRQKNNAAKAAANREKGSGEPSAAPPTSPG